jgi:hypothetical protein
MRQRSKKATVRRYETYGQLLSHPPDFVVASNFANRLKILGAFIPPRGSASSRTKEPDYLLRPFTKILGLKARRLILTSASGFGGVYCGCQNQRTFWI